MIVCEKHGKLNSFQEKCIPPALSDNLLLKLQTNDLNFKIIMPNHVTKSEINGCNMSKIFKLSQIVFSTPPPHLK
jgi:hypothetical protein